MSMDARYRYSQSYAANASIQVPPPTMTSQRFCLRWNNHQSNLLTVFDQLLHDESFVDVTIGVEGQYLKAHKMVLSACSPYFQALFVSTPDKHPIVILKDVPYADMRSLLDFMYRGEVSVDQDRLTAFLRVAENLRIKGLTEVNEDKCDIPSITSSLLNSSGGGNGGGNNNNVQNTMSHSSHRMPPAPPRRPAGQLMSPLLGNALAQPKRKRGRPRKLSGSSNGAPSLDADGSPIVRGSPEMLEVKMNMDGFQGSESDVKRDTDAEGDDGNDIDDKSDVQKEIQEQPVAGTSREQEGYHNNEFHAENHQLYLENNQNHSNTQPSVTFEIITTSAHVQSSKPVDTNRSALESVIISTENARTVPVIQSPMLEPLTIESPSYEKQDMESSAGVHFLTDEENDRLLIPKTEKSDSYESDTVKTKSDLLEYLIRNDGSVICKLCGEILASRTHWYRHKYRIHVNNPANPAPLFKCTRCNIFFKSRKGYIGHISSRHTDEETQRDSSPGDSSITELITVETTETTETAPKNKKRLDGGNTKSTDWEQQREKEEKLVADIIDRVRRECEAQGATVTRRGYSRRTTVMNS